MALFTQSKSAPNKDDQVVAGKYKFSFKFNLCASDYKQAC